MDTIIESQPLVVQQAIVKKEKIETIIIGGGQAGLALSYYLRQAGRQHLVLEASAQPAHAWRNQRWDSFTYVTPNWMNGLPGAPLTGHDPDGFLDRHEIIQYFEDYIQRFDLPVCFNTYVSAVELITAGYRVVTSQVEYLAKNVVIATGYFQNPRLPAYSANLPADVLQLHSTQYRNPEQLPPGAVLVVGSGQSGCQIAEELYLSGREVNLSSVIWATGYRFDYSLVKLPVFNERGYPVQTRGVTAYPGLYFLGMHGLYKAKSGFLYGIGEDAEYLAKILLL